MPAIRIAPGKSERLADLNEEILLIVYDANDSLVSIK